MKFRQSILPFTIALTLTVALPACAHTEHSAGPPDPAEARPAVVQTAPSGIMSIVAGTGYGGYGPLGGLATDADIIAPQGVAVDKSGNLYISAPWLAVVYKVTASTGDIAVYAGTGDGGSSGDGGPAKSAKLGYPFGLALDSAGDLYIADQSENRIRKVTASTLKISTVAGDGAGASIGANDLCSPVVDGIAATSSGLCLPTAVAVDAAGNLYIADYGDNRIRKVKATTGIISTIAGPRNGYAGDGGLAVNASLNYPIGIALDQDKNVYIADTGNCAVRKIEVSTGVIASLTGTPDGNGSGGTNCPNGPGGISIDGTLATAAQVGRTHAIAVDASGNVFFTDSDALVVHLIDSADHKLYTVAGINFAQSNPYQVQGEYYLLAVTPNPGPGHYQWLDDTSGLTTDDNTTYPTYGDIFFADVSDDLVYKVAHPAVTQANMPSIAPAFSTGVGSAQIEITAPVAGSAIYYTTNGKVPSTSSTKYSGPFTLSKSAVITAFTGKSSALSPAAIDVFISNAAPTLAPTYLTSPNPVQVTISDTGTGGAIYYTTDGSDPTLGGSTVKKYTAQITAKDGETVKAAYLPAPVTDFAGNVWQQWSAITTVNYAIQLP